VFCSEVRGAHSEMRYTGCRTMHWPQRQGYAHFRPISTASRERFWRQIEMAEQEGSLVQAGKRKEKRWYLQPQHAGAPIAVSSGCLNGGGRRGGARGRRPGRRSAGPVMGALRSRSPESEAEEAGTRARSNAAIGAASCPGVRAVVHASKPSHRRVLHLLRLPHLMLLRRRAEDVEEAALRH